MNFQEVPVGQAATLWAELQAAYDRKEPVVIFNWTPNFIEAKFEGQFVEFPTYEPACLTDPKWGSNPDAVYDCGAPAKGYLKKAGSKSFGSKWPEGDGIRQEGQLHQPADRRRGRDGRRRRHDAGRCRQEVDRRQRSDLEGLGPIRTAFLVDALRTGHGAKPCPVLASCIVSLEFSRRVGTDDGREQDQLPQSLEGVRRRSVRFPERHAMAPAPEAFKAEGYIGAVQDVSFDVREGEILIVMGLSGSGKSTLIRASPDSTSRPSGEVLFEGRNLLAATEREMIELRRHKMGMVFQHFGLLPHRTVLANVAFPLEVQGQARDEREARAREMIKLVGLEGREDYFPRELSGGQQQRVGIARSLAVEPDIWFLDEPFSALDPLIRHEMQGEFLRLQRILKKTIVFITHDFEEATRLADRIGIMKDGRLVQLATPEEMVTRASRPLRRRVHQERAARAHHLGRAPHAAVERSCTERAAARGWRQDRRASRPACSVPISRSRLPTKGAGLVGEISRERIDRGALPGGRGRDGRCGRCLARNGKPDRRRIGLLPTGARRHWAFDCRQVRAALDRRWPEEWVIPLKAWVTSFFAWLGNEATLGLFTVKGLTRFISLLLSYPLYWAEALLFRGVPDLGLPPLPWIAIVAGVAILGHWIARHGGWRCSAGCRRFYIAVFGLWPDAMQTLSIVIVTVPLAALLGLCARHLGRRARRASKPSSRPLSTCCRRHRTWPISGPVVVLFGFGQVPAMLATLGFAMPPMARCVILGLKHVASEIVEAGRMAGCTPRQLLWKVEMPAAAADAAARPQPGGDADAGHGGHRLARRRLGPRAEAAVLAAATADRQGDGAGHRHHADRHRARPALAGLCLQARFRALPPARLSPSATSTCCSSSVCWC